MSRRDEIIKKLKSAFPFIQNEFGVSSMHLFGSMARGEDNDESDVDLFVEMPPKAFRLLSLIDFLKSLLGREVDVVRNHSRLNDYFRKEIEKDGIRI
ncbi:MAG: nucleotidyltransferase domain-containing protein [Muribaculaceae bacterium]|nr:nucleotidyltransferase domain-containing protein [Muribaculaceae bacterium]